MKPQIAHWNQRYDREDYLFGTEPNAFLQRQQHWLQPGMHALSVADGEGRNGVWLAEQGLDVLAVEAAPLAIAKACHLAAGRGVKLRHECVDLLEWDWGRERFDLIVGIFIQFAGPALRQQMFDSMQRALKPGGLLLLEGYRTEQLAYGTGGPRDIDNLYTEALLREAFADLEILQLESYDAEIHEGSGHHGMSALIDLVARKPV
ncbi:class I SAM-dependent methyltransferase [Pseudomonas sp. NW5]|uniref:SAM-dependent methyltransferase n=1 Tax=Pseudomonas sp. NW5 TaxID=2934934 RepID=UPI002022796F|nr:class I SAM-dependent methyltransferase [Pseudomonas sp. NW5]MCL7461601.1 class I SAM-dependent methyltransferase [Pseudomonas sp. NW5]